MREAAGPLRGLRTRALELSKEGSEVELGNVELCKYFQASLLGIHIPTETSNGKNQIGLKARQERPLFLLGQKVN